MIEKHYPGTLFLLFSLLFLVATANAEIFEPNETGTKSFKSQFSSTPDRVWPGADYWTNPMEDWRIRDGRLECVTPGANRNVHLLRHVLGSARGHFEISVDAGVLDRGDPGSVGFRIGVREPEINDYRSNVFFGEGLDAGLTTDGLLVLAGQQKKLDSRPRLKNIQLKLIGEPDLHNFRLTLTAMDLETGNKIGEISVENIEGDQVVGNIALVNNHDEGNARFWFRNWRVTGSKIKSFPDRKFGPILWSMYSLNNTRAEEGYVLKMSAQMPPIGEQDNDSVQLQVKRDNRWQTIAYEQIDPQARNAVFRITNWNADRDIPYRLVYETANLNGQTIRDEWHGTIRKDPVDTGNLTVVSLNCQHDAGFPYGPVTENVAKIDPEMLTFHGDQLYESNGGYGVVRDVEKEGMERATINYLRKFYMVGWAFGDLMRDRPTILMTDDHDVFQGNIWGEGGAAPDGTNFSTSGGYLMPPEWVNMVYRTQTSHNPDPYDDTPIKRGINVWHGDMVYGGVSFAIIAERMFKSSPKNVDTGGEGRADLVETPDYDPEQFDVPGLNLLGERQLIFLEHWVQDWSGASMKVVLGQTPYANLNTHSGPQGARLYADLDTNAWPQSARNDALRVLRKGFAFHLNGDQHLPTVTQYGIDEYRDANWGFCPPGISVGWPRWWLADEVGIEVQKRPEHGLPNTGQYIGPFGHPSYLYAVGNPSALDGVNRYHRAHQKASGFGVIRLNTEQRTIRMEAYRFLAEVGNPAVDNQFPGWPVTINQLQNYGNQKAGFLS
ncbi:MAG: alkaline phosphatase D family protein [Balneolaceae bacterium]|nr:alkaline phosphatase D family protein [Balneolaceae bacterium]